MGFKTLGLDLGIASIGWAYITDDGHDFQLNGWGSRIFEPGMEDDIDAGKGVSRCAQRRLKAALRRQYRRRRARKDELTLLLTENDLLPVDLKPDFFTQIDKKLLMAFPTEMRRTVGHLLPYFWRKKALERPLERYELGRAIYHLAQRRGYLSNRKQDLKNEDSGVVKDGIRLLKEEMAKSGARTLGEYFCTVDPEKERIRTRYTERSMFVEEFRKICKAQRTLIPEELEEKLFHAIFFQRKLKSCKGLIGKCSYYENERRCRFDCEEAQLFRIYTTVSHLRIANKLEQVRSLTEEERQGCLAVLNGYSDLLTAKGTIQLTKLAKAIHLAKGEKFTLSDESKEIYGNVLHAQLFRVFGERAGQLTAEEQQRFFHDLDSIEKEDVLLRRLTGHWGLSALQAETAMKLAVPDEYCAYSLKALKELLPDLEANVPLATVLKLNRPTVEPRLDALPLLDSPECRIELRNPVVHRTLTELRRVVNAVIARYGKPDAIRIELARNLKSTNKERERMTQQLREREKERAAIADRICQEAGIEKPSRNDILKVMLADECDFTCPYTGRHFTMQELLHGGSIHIEHILPFSRSFDDSFRNKTLCDSAANQSKTNRSPYEAYSGKEYEAILQRVSHFKGPYAEYKKGLFECKEFEPQEFLERNLNDTRYASKLAMRYLAMLYGGIVDPAGRQRIFAISGGHTALVRRAWGGNYLLGEGEKVRSDHRHHAIDALTIALTTPDLVKSIAGMTPEERRQRHEKMDHLYHNAVYDQALAKLNEAAVSHHVVNKLRGALHKETIYGKDYGAGTRHVRIGLAMLEPKDLEAIVDPAIRKLILEKLGKADPQEVTAKDLAVFKEAANLPVLRDRRGEPVNTIRSVRIARTVNARTIGEGDHQREVANGSNHLLAVFATLDGAGKETGWEGEIVSLLDARLRHQKHEPIFSRERPGYRFKFTLQKGDVVRWTKDGKEWLCIVRGVSLPQFYLIPIQDARMQKELKAAHVWFTPTLSAAFAGKMEKLEMNLFGELKRSHD